MEQGTDVFTHFQHDLVDITGRMYLVGHRLQIPGKIQLMADISRTLSYQLCRRNCTHSINSPKLTKTRIIDCSQAGVD